MIPQFSQGTDTRRDSVDARRAVHVPYAGPREAMGSHAPVMVARAPYVPSAFRGVPSGVAVSEFAASEVAASQFEASELAAFDTGAAVAAPAMIDEIAHDYTDASGLALPSIDEFLAIDDASLPRSITGANAAIDGEGEGEGEAETVDTSAEERGDDWAMGDAADRLRSLSEALREKEPVAEPVADSLVSPLLPPLPMWSDDDMIDIMPVPRGDARDARDAESRLFGEQAAQKNEERTTWAAHEPPPADELRVEHGAFGSSEAAASALETLAQRIRNGELPLPGYAPEMGDAAALAATLASLLGLRR